MKPSQFNVGGSMWELTRRPITPLIEEIKYWRWVRDNLLTDDQLDAPMSLPGSGGTVTPRNAFSGVDLTLPRQAYNPPNPPQSDFDLDTSG